MTAVIRTILLLAFSLATFAQAAEVIHKERSLYRNIIVREQDDRRCLLFTVRRSNRNQSCIDLENPDRLVFPYVRMMFSGLLVNPEPERILMVGLGGGSIPRTFHDLNPDAQQDLVEIDEAVVGVAERFFMFTPNERMRVHVRDARVFVKRALARGQTYDYVMLDAFTGEYIPEHLLTREFLEEVRGILAPGGVLVANTFSSSRLYDHETATYKAVFEHLAEVTLPTSLNRILVAYDGEWPAATLIDERAAVLGAAMGRFGVDMQALAAHMTRELEYDADARLLTDQYAPANLLSQ